MQRLKTTVLFTLLLSIGFGGFSQSYSKTIKIEDDSENPRVTISTTKNGKTETVILEGDKAHDYIADEKIETRLSNLTISKADVKKLETGFEKVSVEVEQLMTALDEIEINDADIDGALDDIERVFTNTSKCIKKN